MSIEPGPSMSAESARRQRLTLEVDGVDFELDSARWGDGEIGIVFAHDGLGSIAQWRDVPARTATVAGTAVLAYDRAGHGASTPVPDGAWPPDWMHREAAVLAALIEASTETPVRLVGHSDGGTIALLCAALRPDLVTDVVSLAAHSWVEPKCVASIRSLRENPADTVTRLARHHSNPDELFAAWTGAWTSPAFADWDIRPVLSTVPAPTLVVQGEADEYATEAMAVETAAAIGANATVELVPGCRHLIHRDVPDLVVRWASGDHAAPRSAGPPPRSG